MDNIREKLVELMGEHNSHYVVFCDDCFKDTPEEFNSRMYGLADHLLANNVTVQEWIPVTDRLPQYGERVLITEGNAVFEASLSISHKWVRCGIGWTEGVTHWMPLPAPPKKEE